MLQKIKEVLKNVWNKNKKMCIGAGSTIVCFFVLLFKLIQDNRESTATARANNRECEDLCRSAAKDNRDITRELETAEQTLKTIRKKGSKN